VKTRLQIRPERISGRGGSMLIRMLGDEGKERGEGSSVGDMVKARRTQMGWEEYTQAR